MIEPDQSTSDSSRGAGSEPPRGTAQTTGRYVVVFAQGADDPEPMLRSVAGISSMASTREYGARGIDLDEAGAADATFYANLGIAVVTADQSQRAALQTSDEARGQIVAVAPELIHHVMDSGADYLRGYRHGVMDLSGRLGVDTGADLAGVRAPDPCESDRFKDDDELTWGLQAVRAGASPHGGAGVKVAVLDTGLDLAHPDFVGRSVTAQSFVPGEQAQDGHGHGTHCVGTSCGPKSPVGSRRYGVAHEAEIFVGKVLGDQGSGSDSGILAGIDWAVSNDCAIISMSLGADVAEPHPPYTFAGERALQAGTLIIAAAGNNARRPGNPGFVGAPANSPSIMAVAAVDSELAIAPFSARSLPGRGGQVDVCGPGVAVYSSWPMPTRYRSISGTSMATPHVAGLAALWCEATGRRGLELWATLAQECRRLALPSEDVGSALVLATS